MRFVKELRLCIPHNNATDIELHVHTYAVCVADIAVREGSPHNVLHSSSIISSHLPTPQCTIVVGLIIVTLIEKKRPDVKYNITQGYSPAMLV